MHIEIVVVLAFGLRIFDSAGCSSRPFLLSVQLRVVPEESHRVRQPLLAVEVRLERLLGSNTRIELLEEQGMVFLSRVNFLWERKLQTIQNLPQGSVGICEPASYEIFALAFGLVLLQHTFEIAEELG